MAMFTSQDMCQGAGQKTVLNPCKGRPRNSKTQRPQKIPVTDSRFLNQMWILYNLIFKTHPQSLPHTLLVASSMTPAKNIFLRLLYRFHPVFAYCPEALLHRAALGAVCKPEGAGPAVSVTIRHAADTPFFPSWQQNGAG